MALNSTAIRAALIDHAMTLGLFEHVNGHDPDNAPPTSGLSCAIVCDRVEPARAQSGLISTTALLVWSVRILAAVEQEPADDIDPQILAAVDALVAAYTGDFTLGGLVRMVDVLGALSGGTQPMRAQFGYLQISGVTFRLADLTVPLIVNDAWEQVA